MPTWHFHGNLPTILAYAWICSRQDLQAAVRQDGEGGTWRRKSSEEVIRSLVEQEVALVEAESLHGCLLRLETSSIDLFTIGATLRESSGIYFNASQEEQRLASLQEEEGRDPTREATDIVLAWLKRDQELAWPLCALGGAHRDDLASVARVLSLFFQRKLALVLRNRAFFVRECVRLALERVDWNTVAQCLPSLPPGNQADAPLSDRDAAVRLALFRELLRQTGLELSEWGTRPGLAREFVDLALYLGDLCRKAAQVEQAPAS